MTRDKGPFSLAHHWRRAGWGALVVIQHRTLYIESQLLAFAQGMRQNDISEQMRTITRQLTPEEMHAVAVFYGVEAAVRTTQK